MHLISSIGWIKTNQTSKKNLKSTKIQTTEIKFQNNEKKIEGKLESKIWINEIWIKETSPFNVIIKVKSHRNQTSLD